MSRTTPIHRPYSFKKEVLDAWKDAQKEEGMTKVKFSRMHRVTISTFDKWLAKADEIAKVENGSSKHLRGRSKRGAYSKERPSDEKKGQLYDWIKAAPKPVNQADLRKEARRIWPEWYDMDHDDRKTPGNIRKFCSPTEQHVEQHVDQLADQQGDQLIDQQADQQNDQLTYQQAHQHVNQLADQQTEQHIAQLADQQANRHVNQLADQQTEQHIAQLVDQQANRHVNQLADQQAHQHVLQFTDQQTNQHIVQLTDEQTELHIDQQANQHINQLADQQAGQHVAEITDQTATQHVNQLPDQQAGRDVAELADRQAGQHIVDHIDQQAHQHVNPLIDHQTEPPVNQRTFGDLLDEDLQNSDGLDATKRKRPRLHNDYESADEDDYGKAYMQIDKSLPLRGRTNKARLARLARLSSGSKYNSGIQNDRCYRCSRRSPCVDWRKCSNVDSRHECASDRCSPGKHCQNNVIQQMRFPKTTVVVDPIFGFGLRLDENVPKDTKIIEYVGQLITKDTYLRRKEKGRGQLAWYIARVSREDDNLFVDPTKYGNASRFINHACSPHCRFETWYVDKKPRLMVVSRLPLEKGCILSLHYMDSTWGIACQCGFCDGTYLPPPTDIIDE
ncbi:histone methyltransferase set2 [Aphanomyces cochlioides]|nr:histone methyltransferase set2 [Aphanomyces cochlioides]